MIIYCATHRRSGKQYVGQTQRKTFDKRIFCHVRYSKFYFGNALRKYGLKAFEFKVIDRARTPKELNRKERYWIKKLNTMAPNGYNLTAGAEKEGGFVTSARTRRLKGKRRKEYIAAHPEELLIISKRQKNWWKQLDPKEKERICKQISKSLTGQSSPFKGIKRGPFRGAALKRVQAAARRNGRANKGRKRPDLTMNSLVWINSPGYVNPMKGKKRPDLAALNRSRRGTTVSAETRAKMSASHKANPPSPAHRAAINKALRARSARLKKVA